MHGRVPLPLAGHDPASGAAPVSGRGFGIRAHLGMLVAIALLPALALGTLMFWRAATEYRAQAEARLMAEARGLARAIARDVAMRRVLAETLAALPEAADPPGRLDTFDSLARRVAAPIEGWVLLWEADTGRMLVNTRVARDGPMPDSPPAGPLRDAALAAGEVTLSQLAVSGRVPAPYLSVAAPVTEQGRLVRLVMLNSFATRLVPVVANAALPNGGFATLIDGTGRVIARSHEQERFVGAQVMPWSADTARQPRIVRRRNLAGEDVLLASHPVPETPDWYVVVAEPWRRFASLHNEHFVAPLAGEVATFALGILLIAWFAGRIVRRVQALTDAPPDQAPPPSGIRELDALAGAIVEARAGLRQRAEEAEEQRALVASVLDAAADPIFAKDLQLRFVMANRATNRIIDAPEAPLAGRSAFDTADPASAALAEAQDRHVIETGMPWTGEHRILRPEGAQLFVTTKVPWRNAAGSIIGVVGVARDITRARAAEERLAAAQARLLQVSRLGATGAMAAGLAHEINQPLTAVSNYTSAAARLLGEPGSPPPPVPRLEEVRRVLPAATAQARRAGDILARLRGFISDGAGEHHPEPLDEVLHDAAAIAGATLAREQAELLLDIPRPLGHVRVDRVQIQQVLLNLLRNAAEAMREGNQRRVRLSAWRVAPAPPDAGGVVIEVADTGPGLPPEVEAHLFEPFITTKPDGLGVGLAICRSIIEAHGGTLQADRGREGGACFRITLPDPDAGPVAAGA
jgi:PAS domain S-box-containing protein